VWNSPIVTDDFGCLFVIEPNACPKGEITAVKGVSAEFTWR